MQTFLYLSTLSTFFHYFCIDTTCNIQDLEEWTNLETTELHSDQESESSTGSGENFSGGSEIEEYSPNILKESSSKLSAPILIFGERNRIYNNCQFTINRNDKESRRFREVYQEPAGSVRRRRVSTETNLDPNPGSASENESSDNAVTSLKNWVEQLGRDTDDVYEICERIEGHHNIVEQENIRLKRENDLLKQQIASTNTTEPPENDKNSPENDEDTPENDKDSPENDEDTPENDKDSPENDEDTPENDKDSPENDEDTPENDKDSPENDEDTPENDDATGGNQTFIVEETLLQRERHEGCWENICAFLQWLYAQGLSVLQSTRDIIVSLLVGTRPMITAAQVS